MSAPPQHKMIPIERKPRVLKIVDVARQLSVAPSTVRAWLDSGDLTPWYAPLAPGATRRTRMVMAASVERLIERGTIDTGEG